MNLDVLQKDRETIILYDDERTSSRQVKQFEKCPISTQETITCVNFKILLWNSLFQFNKTL
jgi:hypothetical protein